MQAKVLVETGNLTNEEWLRYRKQGIGGSDVSSILGINPWKSKLELWMDKTSDEVQITPSNEAMEWGNIMEPVIREHFSLTTGKRVQTLDAILQHHQHQFMLADVDGITVDDHGNPAILEIKTASEYKRTEWDNGVPAYYQSQVQHYLTVTGYDSAYVAVLIGGNSFQIYEIKADKSLQAMLIAVEERFWESVVNHEQPDIDGSDSAKNLLDLMYKGGETEVLELPETARGYIMDFFAAQSAEDKAKAEKQLASNHIKELMGNSESAVCGEFSIKWKSITTDRIDSKALKESEPDIYQKYIKSSSSRRFSIK